MACGGSNRRKSRGRSPRAIKLKVFYWKHLFANFLALSGTFWLFHSILVRFQRNSGFKLLFQSYFQPRGRFFSFHVRLFVRLAAGRFFSKNTDGVTFCNFLAISLQNSFFLPSLVKRTINLGIFFFQIFKGFTLLPWQKVGRI